MKKFKFWSILMLMIMTMPLFVACGDDDDNSSNTYIPEDNDDEGGSTGIRIGNGPDVTGSISGHDYVDLGLSVKWATCNIGASSPEGIGKYYAWAETYTKSSYTYKNYRNYKPTNPGYIITALFSDISGTSYDAAYDNWGNSWRMPTRKEMDELDGCAWKWMSYNGVLGCLFTGPNGKSLFLPAAGYYDDDELKDYGQYGYYWSSTRSSSLQSEPNNYPWAQALTFGQTNSLGIDAASGIVRYHGLTVRAVLNESGSGSGSGSGSSEVPYVTSFTFSATKSSITVNFMCTERPTSATVKYGTSSPSSTVSSSISGKQVSATVSGLKSGTKYYFKCTVSNGNGSSTSDTFSAITNY